MASAGLSDQLLDPGEARKALRLSARSLDKLDDLGILPKIRIPELDVVRYRLSDVQRLIAGADGIERIISEGTAPVRKRSRR